ncbi:FtsB family cell division protein [Arthrobacter sp. KK5.5]|uniref:FtsB family cell division protein n=1 Tax=Arthrobacter sp. KK5.5 TaxID=3373084 RepID=UPI003EE51433
MATRRPNMPRANRDAGAQRGAGAPHAGVPERAGAQERSGAPEPPAKVIPLGAAPAARPRRPASERRLRERVELSGSIRAPKNMAAGATRPEAPSRPPGAGGVGGAQPEAAAPVPARSFSGRMLALAVVLVAITILLLPSVGTYMTQRAEMGELRESIAAKQAEQAELNEQIARWDDPVYIKQQARDRINLVMPGERKYMVIGSAGEDPVVESQSPGEVRTDLPWVDALWDTVKRSATD